MVRITEELIRSRAEHNEKIISTLEEISLHQQDIEKIEWIDKWCRDLKILYLQSNVIDKIENIGRLKKLEYLNLALNNIESIENLEGCESLKKLDLTVNFVGNLTDIERLQANRHLEELFLTGNPCTEYAGYKDFIIAVLPNLKRLDGTEIEKSERILACQALIEVRPLIIQQQNNYKRKRDKQKKKAATGEENSDGTDWYCKPEGVKDNKAVTSSSLKKEGLNSEEEVKDFWNESTEYTPESRKEIHDHIQKQKQKEELERNPPKPSVERKLITDDGRVLNINEAKVSFSFIENDENILLNVVLFKYLDTSLIDVDVQPNHVKVWVKGQLLQLTLPEEVKPDSGTAKRSDVTGHLLLTMPKLNPVLIIKKDEENNKPCDTSRKIQQSTLQEKLEIDPKFCKKVDIANIVSEKKRSGIALKERTHKHHVERPNSANFVDDPDVPPLV